MGGWEGSLLTKSRVNKILLKDVSHTLHPYLKDSRNGYRGKSLESKLKNPLIFKGQEKYRPNLADKTFNPIIGGCADIQPKNLGFVKALVSRDNFGSKSIHGIISPLILNIYLYELDNFIYNLRIENKILIEEFSIKHNLLSLNSKNRHA